MARGTHGHVPALGGGAAAANARSCVQLTKSCDFQLARNGVCSCGRHGLPRVVLLRNKLAVYDRVYQWPATVDHYSHPAGGKVCCPSLSQQPRIVRPHAVHRRPARCIMFTCWELILRTEAKSTPNTPSPVIKKHMSTGTRSTQGCGVERKRAGPRRWM